MATPLAAIEQLSSRVIRVLGCNPGHMTLQGTNSYIVGTGKRRILIDTSNPGIPLYSENLKQTLVKHSCTLHDIVVTHWHHDHVGAVPEVCKDVLSDNEMKVSKIACEKRQEYDLKGAGVYEFIKDKHVFHTEGATLQAIHTPGHSEDHIMLFLEEENAIFGGDNILGEGTTAFEEYYEYMKSLNLMLNMKPSVIYPGHGPVLNDPVTSLSDYINHRQQREEQIIDVLRASHPTPVKADFIVSNVYKGLDQKLFLPAKRNVLNHLVKLFKEGEADTTDVTDPESEWTLREPSKNPTKV